MVLHVFRFLSTALMALAFSGGDALASPPLTDQDILDIIRERIDVEKKGVAIVVGVIDENGRRVISHGVTSRTTGQRVNSKSIFEIGSITKVFTTLILADMVENGEVTLSDPVSMYLPKSVTVPHRNGKQITLGDLATHTSGLPRVPDNLAPKNKSNPYADYSVGQLYAFISGFTLTRDIGSKEEYSNVGVALLAHALALHARMDYDALVRARITIPLDMNATTTILTPALQGHLAMGHLEDGTPAPPWDSPTLPGSGALRSSMDDMLKFLAANMGMSDTPLKAAIERAHRPLLAYGDRRLAWEGGGKYASKILSHGGQTFGYKAYIGFDKVAHRGVVVLSNSQAEVVDIGSKIINSQYRLSQKVPPKMFVRALETGGYDRAIPLYEQFKLQDADFHLKEEIANEWGYELAAQNKLAQGIEILKLGVYIRPGSANAYDSLAEAYEKKGDNVNAIHNYSRSLELDPKNAHAIERLRVLDPATVARSPK